MTANDNNTVTIFTSRSLVVDSQVIESLITNSVIGPKAAIPLYHNSLIWCIAFTRFSNFNHSTDMTFAAVLVLPFPVRTPDNSQSEFHEIMLQLHTGSEFIIITVQDTAETYTRNYS